MWRGRWLAGAHQWLVAAARTDLESGRSGRGKRWKGRFADVLDEDLEVEADLRVLIEVIRAALAAGTMAAVGRGGGRVSAE